MALLDANGDIVLSGEGTCRSLYGSGTLETYREILLSARYIFHSYNIMRSFLCTTDT